MDNYDLLACNKGKGCIYNFQAFCSLKHRYISLDHDFLCEEYVERRLKTENDIKISL
ncbi:MAG: hypothetical protein ACFE9P_14850 [Candidatus Hermodarchaeota archaeon]